MDTEAMLEDAHRLLAGQLPKGRVTEPLLAAALLAVEAARVEAVRERDEMRGSWGAQIDDLTERVAALEGALRYAVDDPHGNLPNAWYDEARAALGDQEAPTEPQQCACQADGHCHCAEDYAPDEWCDEAFCRSALSEFMLRSVRNRLLAVGVNPEAQAWWVARLDAVLGDETVLPAAPQVAPEPPPIVLREADGLYDMGWRYRDWEQTKYDPYGLGDTPPEPAAAPQVAPEPERAGPLAITCPKCGAKPGDGCMYPKGPATSTHAAREKAAARLPRPTPLVEGEQG